MACQAGRYLASQNGATCENAQQAGHGNILIRSPYFSASIKIFSRLFLSPTRIFQFCDSLTELLNFPLLQTNIVSRTKGTYGTQIGATSAAACLSCAAGQGSVEGATSCSACVAGKFSTAGNPCQDCVRGKSSVTSARACTTCIGGHFCVRGTPAGREQKCGSAQVYCPAGSYQPKNIDRGHYGSFPKIPGDVALLRSRRNVRLGTLVTMAWLLCLLPASLPSQEKSQSDVQNCQEAHFAATDLRQHLETQSLLPGWLFHVL